MKKKLLFVMLSLILCFGLIGCGSSGEDESNESPSSEITPLEIVDSGYSYADGYVYYSIKIKNPNENMVAQYPGFRIVARDAEGNVLSSQEQALMEIYPGATVGYASLGFDISAEPAAVEFEIIESEYMWISESEATYPSFIELGTVGVNATQDEFGGMSYSGEIVNENVFDISSVAVCILYKDADGKALGGEVTFVDSVKASGNTAFTLDVFGDYYTDNYEICVMPW